MLKMYLEEPHALNISYSVMHPDVYIYTSLQLMSDSVNKTVVSPERLTVY